MAKQMEGNSRVDGKQGWFHHLFYGKIISAVVRRGDGSEFGFEYIMFAKLTELFRWRCRAIWRNRFATMMG